VLHRWALIAGWLAGMVYGSYIAYGTHTATVQHFASPSSQAPLLDQTVYIAVTALVINIVIAVVATVILRLIPGSVGADETSRDDYLVDAGAPGLKSTPVLVTDEPA
jgi:SSS family solute:Na+ symporter